jgi:putative tryptophan/tyrosine transport system substrate-binding protein
LKWTVNRGRIRPAPYGERRQEAAQRLGLLPLGHRLKGTLQETEYRRFFEVMAQEHADSLFVGYEVESWGHRRLIVELAEKNRLPAIYPYRDYVDAGGPAISFVQVVVGLQGDIGKWIERPPELPRIGSSAPWS